MIDEIKENTEQLEISTGYTVKLEVKNLGEFEGPLDLLLHLVRESKVAIQDIFISKVTNHFLEYMQQLDELDMDSASEFLEVAATLLEVKSKAILPKIENEVEEEDEGKKLVQRLEEYMLYKEAVKELKEQEIVGQFYKEPDNSAFKPQFIIKDMKLEGLLNAFSKMLNRIEKNANIDNSPKEIKKDIFTVKDKIEYIINVVLEKKTTSFFSLFSEAYEKIEVIITFQALLELLKLQIIDVVQDVSFDDILINLKQGAEDIINKVEVVED